MEDDGHGRDVADFGGDADVIDDSYMHGVSSGVDLEGVNVCRSN